MQHFKTICKASKFARFQQVCIIFRTAGQPRLLLGVGLIEQQSPGSDGLQNLWENLPVQIQENHYQVKLSLRSSESSEIIYYKVDVGRERPGVLPRLFHTGVRDIDERDFPALFC